MNVSCFPHSKVPVRKEGASKTFNKDVCPHLSKGSVVLGYCGSMVCTLPTRMNKDLIFPEGDKIMGDRAAQDSAPACRHRWFWVGGDGKAKGKGKVS